MKVLMIADIRPLRDISCYAFHSALLRVKLMNL